MNRMKFPTPENDKPLSKNTKKVYQGYLNKLAEAGVMSVEELLKDQEVIVQYINQEGKDNRTKRAWMSAVFWALHDVPLAEKKDYYNFFQSLKVDSEGNAIYAKFLDD